MICGTEVWGYGLKGGCRGAESKDLMLCYLSTDTWKRSMTHIFYTTAYTLQPFARLAQAVVCCCLVSHGGSLWHSGALRSGKSIGAAAGPLCSIKARVLSSPSLCLSPTVICFIYGEEQRVKLWVVSQVAVGSGSVLLCLGKCWWYTVGARTDK